MPHDLRNINGTEIRATVPNQVRPSADFRAGVIHAITNKRPVTLATVDVVITHKAVEAAGKGLEANRFVTYFLLAQKPWETTQWRFVGGFSEPDGDSYEQNAKREAMEETGFGFFQLKNYGLDPV